MNAVEIEEAISLLAEQPFDPAEFPYAFLKVFGNKPTTIKQLKKGTSNKSDVEGGILQRNNIHIFVCGAGAVRVLHVSAFDPKRTLNNEINFFDCGSRI